MPWESLVYPSLAGSGGGSQRSISEKYPKVGIVVG